jgi:hypothetical protein
MIGPFVQVGRHVVGGGADQLHAAFVRLVVRARALEAGQELWWMLIARPDRLRHRSFRQDLHVARQHHQVGALGLDDLQLPGLCLRLGRLPVIGM